MKLALITWLSVPTASLRMLSRPPPAVRCHGLRVGLETASCAGQALTSAQLRENLSRDISFLSIKAGIKTVYIVGTAGYVVSVSALECTYNLLIAVWGRR